MFRIIVHFFGWCHRMTTVQHVIPKTHFSFLCRKQFFLICNYPPSTVSLTFFFWGDGGEFCEKKPTWAGGLSSDACARVCFCRQRLMKQMADCCFSSWKNTSTLEIWILVSIRNLPWPYGYTSFYVFFFVNFFWHQVSLCLQFWSPGTLTNTWGHWMLSTTQQQVFYRAPKEWKILPLDLHGEDFNIQVPKKTGWRSGTAARSPALRDLRGGRFIAFGWGDFNLFVASIRIL